MKTEAKKKGNITRYKILKVADSFMYKDYRNYYLVAVSEYVSRQKTGKRFWSVATDLGWSYADNKYSDKMLMSVPIVGGYLIQDNTRGFVSEDEATKDFEALRKESDNAQRRHDCVADVDVEHSCGTVIYN